MILSNWSCTHVNSCSKYTLYINLHILLIILFKASLKIQKSSKSIKYNKVIHRTSLNFWNNLLLHHIAFKSEATWIYR